MSPEFKNAFDVLDINTKRNKISDELIIIHKLITKIESLSGIEPITNVKNYDIINDEILNESQMLTFLYEDVFNIQQELITLLSKI